MTPTLPPLSGLEAANPRLFLVSLLKAPRVWAIFTVVALCLEKKKEVLHVDDAAGGPV